MFNFNVGVHVCVCVLAYVCMCHSELKATCHPQNFNGSLLCLVPIWNVKEVHIFE